METFAEPFSKLVGKKSRDGESWLPLFAHLLDTAGVMKHLYQRWLPKNIINKILWEHPGIDSELLEKVCVFCALSHDIGKGTSVFQAMICEGSDFLLGKVLSAGFEVPPQSEFMDREKTWHPYAGEAILLKAGCPRGIAAIIGAHHGIPYPMGRPEKLIRDYRKNFYSTEKKCSQQADFWENAWDAWIKFSLKQCGFDTLAELPILNSKAQMIISGFLTMADWISSNEYLAPLINVDQNGTALQYPARSDLIMEKFHLPSRWIVSNPCVKPELFASRFGFYPNRLQNTMIRLVEEAETPGIYIVEAPMGEGKTEAALAAAEILASKWGCEGIFFGLPTQATANGIFPRVKAWIEKQSKEGTLSVKLAHGMAALQDDYRSLPREPNSQQKTGVIVHDWFNGRWQSLLPSIVIGTIDQLLLMALQQKLVTMKHFGLAGKIVVIDECHAYDAYMNCYLDRAIEWLGEYKVPVILLSATLPVKRRTELIQSYLHGGYGGSLDNWEKNTGYPVITYADDGKIKQCLFPPNPYKKVVRVVRGEVDDIFDFIKIKLSSGGCAGIIVNTVNQAQEIAKKMKSLFPGFEVLLLHARFTMDDRKNIEETLLRRIGKRSTWEMRNKLIVVGTQILEQSLDIDFDVLVTQTAPMDLLLQRIGRLHRHTWRSRPECLNEPTCMVFSIDEPDKGSEMIYGDWLSSQTKRLLPEKIVLPDDISPLIQDAYSDCDDSDEGTQLYEQWKAHKEKIEEKRKKAEKCRLMSPYDLDGTIHRILQCSVGDREIDGLAKVRDIGVSISAIIVMCEDGKIARFISRDGVEENIPCDRIPEEKTARKLLLQKVQLPHILYTGSRYEQCINELEELNDKYFSAWRHSHYLEDEIILPLTNNLSARICGHTISYSKDFGIVCNKEQSKEEDG